jgi:hypothetical protein
MEIGYGLDCRGVGVGVPVEANFSPPYVTETSYGAHQTNSYPVGTGVLSLGVNRPGCEIDSSPRSALIHLLSKLICFHVGWVPVPTAWRVLGLRVEERPPAMEGSWEYIE